MLFLVFLDNKTVPIIATKSNIEANSNGTYTRSIRLFKNFYRLIIFTSAYVFTNNRFRIDENQNKTKQIKQKETIAPNRVILGL
jgi:hypothetical protein